MIDPRNAWADCTPRRPERQHAKTQSKLYTSDRSCLLRKKEPSTCIILRSTYKEKAHLCERSQKKATPVEERLPFHYFGRRVLMRRAKQHGYPIPNMSWAYQTRTRGELCFYFFQKTQGPHRMHQAAEYQLSQLTHFIKMSLSSYNGLFATQLLGPLSFIVRRAESHCA